MIAPNHAVTPLRSRSGRRAISVLRWIAITLLISQVAINFWLDYLMPEIRFPAAYKVLERAESLSTRPDIVCLGSSRTGSAFEHGEMTHILRRRTGDASVLAFNASVPAGDYLVCRLMLDEFLARGVVPKAIILETLPEMLNHRNDWLRLHVGRHLGWSDAVRYFPELVATGNSARLAGARLAPLFAHRGPLRDLLAERCQRWLGETPEAEPFFPPDRRIAEGELHVWMDWLAVERKKKGVPNAETVQGIEDIVKALRDYHVGGCSADSLDAILRMCRTRGIRPILVALPVSSAHRSLYTPAIEAEFQAHLAYAKIQYAAEFFDCRAELPDDCFVDCHHHNSQGCLLFTRLFTSETLANLWRNGVSSK